MADSDQAAPGAPAEPLGTTAGDSDTGTAPEATPAEQAPATRLDEAGQDGVITSGQASQPRDTTSSGTEGASGDGEDGDGGTDGADGDGRQQPLLDAQRVEDLPEWAQKEIRSARKEAGDYRVRATAAEKAAQETQDRQAEVLERLAAAIGLTSDDDADDGEDGEGQAPDPEELSAAVTAAQAKARSAHVSLAVYRLSGEHDADPDALLDSRAFAEQVAELDPDADDFTDRVGEAIDAATAANPKLKATPTGQAPAQAAPSGGEFAGGPGGQSTADKSVEDFRADRRQRRRSGAA